MSTRIKRVIGKLILSILFPVIILGGLEWTLRVSGVGYPTDFLLKRAMGGSVHWVNNPFYGYRFFDPEAARNPAPIQAAIPTPPGTTRIMVLGESAAMGDPVIEFSLARALSKFLNKPGENERFEVLNASMTAINSHVIADIAEEISGKDADVLVIYMGNNEVVGPYGPGTVITSGDWGVRLTPLRVALTKLRLTSTLRAAMKNLLEVKKTNKTWAGMEMFAENNLSFDDPALEPMYRQFERNLNRIVHAGLKNGAKVILCSMAVNLTDCAPFGSEHRTDLDASSLDAWDSFFDQGVDALSDRRYHDAEEYFSRALKLDDTFAELAYRYAKVLEALEQYDSAAIYFAKARDLDTQRFRTDSRLNEIIRRTADNNPDSVTFVDIESVFNQADADEELFLDHVHFSLPGLYVLSREVAAAIGEWFNQPVTLTRDELYERLFVTAWGKRKQMSVMLQRRERPPFADQWENKEWKSRARNTSRELSQVIDRTSLTDVEALYHQLAEKYPDDPEYQSQWGQILAVSDEWEKAAGVLTDAVRKRSGYSDIHGLAALALCRSGQPESAVDLLLSTGKPYGSYLQDAALLLITTLDAGGHTNEAKTFAVRLLEKERSFLHRDRVANWLQHHR